MIFEMCSHIEWLLVTQDALVTQDVDKAPVGHKDGGAAGSQLREAVHDAALSCCVECRGRLVTNQ